ncbi:MAG TPA: hypothetical protein ENN75_03360 [candidate division Zixibacteria bacterium]|nr:hypothetical protein [candidate division Zixibacteria bacterium]
MGLLVSAFTFVPPRSTLKLCNVLLKKLRFDTATAPAEGSFFSKQSFESNHIAQPELCDEKMARGIYGGLRDNKPFPREKYGINPAT